jgi:predicted lactoylglutathione lyase
MIHVENIAAAVAFYEALGATVITQSRDGDYAQLAIGGAEISLLAHPANPEQHEGQVELNFESDEPLDALQKRLEAAGVKIARGAADEAFGSQLQLEAPDGMLVKINRLDPQTFQ